MKHISTILISAFTIFLAGCHHEDNKPDPLLVADPTKDTGNYSSLRKFPLAKLMQSEVKVNGREIPVWVADTQEKEAEGLMYLRVQDVPDGHGMIFIMPKPQQQSFYMANCFMELDIAFIGANKKVLNVMRGKKFDAAPLPSKGPSQFVLELKPGEAAKFGVKPGVAVDIPSDLTYKK